MAGVWNWLLLHHQGFMAKATNAVVIVDPPEKNPLNRLHFCTPDFISSALQTRQLPTVESTAIYGIQHTLRL